MSGLRVTRIIHEGIELPSTLSVEPTYSGDDVDFDATPGVAGQDQWKQPVRVATTANVTIATALNAGDTIDGLTLAAGDRVLVKDQSTASQNGIYVAGTTPARSADMDENDEVVGASAYVIAGTANGGKTFSVTNTTAPVIDTDAITWAAVSGATPADDTLAWMPLTTVLGGTPDLVWDADDSLIPTLVSV